MSSPGILSNQIEIHTKDQSEAATKEALVTSCQGGKQVEETTDELLAKDHGEEDWVLKIEYITDKDSSPGKKVFEIYSLK